MQAIALTEAAQSLLRLRIEVGQVVVTSENLEAYRELARAGIMYPVSGFVSGPEGNFRFTEEGWARREEWLSAPSPRPGARAVVCDENLIRLLERTGA
jgi:hypothetical protein